MNLFSLTVDTLAGIAGGVASVLVGHPLDTVKVQMQLFPDAYGSMFKSIVKTFRRRGVKGLYAGSTPALASNCAENAVMFGTYGLCQKMVLSDGAGGGTAGLSYAENAAAGGISSLFTSIVICPTELVKIRMQGVPEYSLKCPTVFQVVKKLWKTNGPKGLYRGLGWTLARESIGCTAFFGSYEWTREQLKPAGKRKEDCTPLATLTAGAVAGLLNWSIVYPIDVIKSRVQISEKHSGFRMARDEIRNAGFRSLYCGLWPTLLKTVPVTAVLFFTVEFSKPFFRRCLSKLANVSSTELPVLNNSFSFCDFMSGWAAGTVSTLVGHPMDTVRIVQQVTNTNALQAARDVYRQDKFAGYFRGMMFPILSMGVTNSVFFGIYGNVMRRIQKYRSDSESEDTTDIRLCCEIENLHKFWHLDVFVSGCVGGFGYSLINIPSEVVKTMLQASSILEVKPESLENGKTSQSAKVISPVKLIVDLYKANGIRSLYRGGTLLMIRDVPCMGIYMVTYEHMCCVLKEFWPNETTKNEAIPKQIQMVSGGMAGVASWMFVLPFDVIKSKIIADSLVAEPSYKGVWDCVKNTYRTGGVAQFFRGFWLLCFRAFPVNGITFVVYEVLMDACDKSRSITSTGGRIGEANAKIKTDETSKWS